MRDRLNIKNEEAYRAATRLAEMTGQTKKAVVIRVLREALERLQPGAAELALARPDVAAAPAPRD